HWSSGSSRLFMHDSIMLRRTDRVRLQVEITAFPLKSARMGNYSAPWQCSGNGPAVNVALYGDRGSLPTPGPATRQNGWPARRARPAMRGWLLLVVPQECA